MKEQLFVWCCCLLSLLIYLDQYFRKTQSRCPAVYHCYKRFWVLILTCGICLLWIHNKFAHSLSTSGLNYNLNWLSAIIWESNWPTPITPAPPITLVSASNLNHSSTITEVISLTELYAFKDLTVSFIPFHFTWLLWCVYWNSKSKRRIRSPEICDTRMAPIPSSCY